MAEVTEARPVEKKKSYLVQNAEKITGALEKGTAPFLPGKSGVIAAEPIRSADSGKVFNGMNQVLLQMNLKENGYKDDTVCTWDQANKAGTFIKAGAKSFPITVYDAETRESKVYHYFPASEAGNPEKFRTPDRIVKDQLKAPPIECKETEPAKYLGKYFAAQYLETEFKASPEVQKGFQKNMLAEIHGASNQVTKPFEIGNRASKECKEILSGMYKNAWVQDKRQEREAERAREREGPIKQTAKTSDTSKKNRLYGTHEDTYGLPEYSMTMKELKKQIKEAEKDFERTGGGGEWIASLRDQQAQRSRSKLPENVMTMKELKKQIKEAEKDFERTGGGGEWIASLRDQQAQRSKPRKETVKAIERD
jgi:hypothetical protein